MCHSSNSVMPGEKCTEVSGNMQGLNNRSSKPLNRLTDMYVTVPTQDPHFDIDDPAWLLTPKSAIFTSPLRLSSRFAGLMSRCFIRNLWRYWRPKSTCRLYVSVSMRVDKPKICVPMSDACGGTGHHEWLGWLRAVRIAANQERGNPWPGMGGAIV
jgi:hypothetical protein